MVLDFDGGTRRRFSSSGRSRVLENETIRLEKKLEEMRTVMQVDNNQMESRLSAKSNKFIWQGGRSGKLRQFKYGKMKNKKPTPPVEGRDALNRRPKSSGLQGGLGSSKDPREKENQARHEGNAVETNRRPLTPEDQRVKKETHSIEISTSPIPILEEDLVSPQEQDTSGLWFPGAACVPQAPEKHEMCVGTDKPAFGGASARSRARPSFEQSFLSTRRKTDAPQGSTGGQGAGETPAPKPLVNSYFAKLYLAKSLRADRETESGRAS